MLSASIERVLSDLNPSMITDIFLGAIAVVFVIAIGQAARRKHSQFLVYAPTLLTSLGILGTFTGIVIGLLHFDVTNIDASIPGLLEGLKTAFISSVVGMVAAIVFNSLDAWFFAPARDANGQIADVTPEHIHAALQEQTILLRAIGSGLTAGEDSSLISQVRFLRSDLSDVGRQIQSNSHEFSAQLFTKLEHFAEMMSKSATGQIIEALQEVIHDFNKNLTEQFGENFKRLDESVKKLVEWQVQYKEQVEIMGQQYSDSVEALVETKSAVGGIWEECKEIPLAMAELKQVLEINQHQIDELQNHLEAFVFMRDAAVAAVPTIQSKIEEVGEQLMSSSSAVHENLIDVSNKLLSGSNEMRVALNEGAEQFRDSVKTTQGSFAELSNTVKSTSEEVTETLKVTTTEVSNTSRDMLARMQSAVNEMQQSIANTAGVMEKQSERVNNHFIHAAEEFTAANSRIIEQVSGASSKIQEQLKEASKQMIEESMSQTGGAINRKLELLEEATEREVNKVMTDMGKALAAISGRFVDDYGRLVAQMDAVVGQQPVIGRAS